MSNDFIETLGIGITEGRSFSSDLTKESTTVILNEAAIAQMEMIDPIGKRIDLFGTKREIIGIAKNFHFQSMYERIKPIFLICNPRYTDKIIVKIQSG